MRQPRSDWEAALAESVQRCLRPIIRMLLRLGMGAVEFTSIAKAVYVQIATEEYGIRGRPTNASRVAAMTGLSRKEVSRIRAVGRVREWTPREEATPVNEVLHYWHVDPEFLDAYGCPRTLPMRGEDRSFEVLVARYAGDIPAGAMRRELESRDAIHVTDDGQLKVCKRFVHSTSLDEDFVRNLAFSLEGLSSTLVHNSTIVEKLSEGGGASENTDRFLERIAWTSHLTSKEIGQFRAWAKQEGSKFIEHADSVLGQQELPPERWGESDGRTVGIGLYYFELNQSSTQENLSS